MDHPQHHGPVHLVFPPVETWAVPPTFWPGSPRIVCWCCAQSMESKRTVAALRLAASAGAIQLVTLSPRASGTKEMINPPRPPGRAISSVRFGSPRESHSALRLHQRDDTTLPTLPTCHLF